MKISKDIYEYLLELVDDGTVLNMLSVNRKFNNQNYFEKVVKRKYNHLLKYKEIDDNWRYFFVKIIYYNFQLENRFGVKYIYTKGFNPIKLCNYFKISSSIFKPLFFEREIVRRFLRSIISFGNSTNLLFDRKNFCNLVKFPISFGNLVKLL